jgi:hypothetical protein
VSALAPELSFNGSTTVASFTFITTYDPMYPNNSSSLLALRYVRVATFGGPVPIPILSLVFNGNYTINSAKSKLRFKADQYVATHVPTEFDATLNVTSAVNLSGFNFTCHFNSTLLNVIYLNVSSSFGGMSIGGWDNNLGYFWVNVTGIGPINGTRILMTVHFRVARGFVWNTVTPTVSCPLFFMNDTLVTQTGTPIDHDAINGTYIYKPLQGDVNMDGKVDIVDLVMVAQIFGASTGDIGLYNVNLDLNRDGTIDIIDVIYVAYNFGSSTGP